MILTSAQIEARGIVGDSVPGGKRASTYDATVGRLVSNGSCLEKKKFRLKRRGIVWVISNERFTLPLNVTGLATLRTTWTHKGVLALNVGIVDPGYSGPLATALVNFGRDDFLITKGDPFLRVIFHEHEETNGSSIIIDNDDYELSMERNSERTSDTFLDMKALARELNEAIFSSGTWSSRITRFGLMLSVFAVFVTILAVFAPISYQISQDYIEGKVEIKQLRGELEDLKSRQNVEDVTFRDLLRRMPPSSAIGMTRAKTIK